MVAPVTRTILRTCLGNLSQNGVLLGLSGYSAKQPPSKPLESEFDLLRLNQAVSSIALHTFPTNPDDEHSGLMSLQDLRKGLSTRAHYVPSEDHLGELIVGLHVKRYPFLLAGNDTGAYSRYADWQRAILVHAAFKKPHF